ncbi:serine/threonine protein kinase [Brunnivagina elsteri]|uniref:non-specific serine/threonine protein kinase n=1 Tax=Brunnivagina elsteri CCALA 953 TaxID=987040 RepID=A0A2A2TK13_9CYAN|nr:protein kinase [Calothrix elsteri]PAX55249.1 serine/threonine protein kinase [Calothrix elsteri CCALA 953]
MILCINPNCNKPENRSENRFCANCGSELLLAGRYQVITKNQSDNSDCEYEVKEVGNETIKYLQTLISNNSQEVEYFHKTAEVLKQLNHPGLPKVEIDGCFVYFPRDKTVPLHCLIMEKFDGLSLDKYLSSKSLLNELSKQQENYSIDEKLAVNWLQQVIEILQQIHNHNLLHLQIQPANILLKQNGNLALIGFAKPRINKKIPFIAAYIPPEQINNNTVPQSDFFALGRTFAFLLTGKSPISHLELYEPSLENDMPNHNQNQDNWHNYASKISSTITNLLDKMMSDAPINRPQNAQEILQILAGLNPIATPLNVSQITQNPSIPVTQKSNFAWYFLFNWIIAIASGGTIGGFVGFVAGFIAEFLLGAAFKNTTIGFIFGGAIFGLITGIGIGLMQSLLLRQNGFKLRWWFLVTILGFTIEGIVGVLTGNYGTQNGLFFIPGLAVGMCQWWVLQRHVQPAFWWILASVGGGGVGVVINKAVNYYLGNAYSIFGIILSLFGFAVVTGFVLQLLLMRSHLSTSDKA